MAGFDLSEAPEDFESGGGYTPRVAEGKGHFLVVDAEDCIDYVKVTSDVLAHADEDSVGQKMEDRLSYDGKYAHKGVILARACGLVTNEQIKKAQAEKTKILPDVEALKSTTFCATVLHRKTDKGTFANFKWDYCSPTEGRTNGYPVDPEFLD